MKSEPPLLQIMSGRKVRPRKEVVPRSLEATLHFATADILRKHCRSYWRWSHFPAGEARDVRTGAKLKRMGLQRGWPDFLLLGPTNRINRRGGLLFALELKRQGEGLSEDQELFADWCKANNVPHAVCSNIDEVLAVLSDWDCLSISIAPSRKGGVA